MTATDLAWVQRVACAVHPAYPEADAIFAERLALYPPGCFVLETSAGIDGYVVSHPWRQGPPPALNTLLHGLPAKADTYYLHDLALMPGARGAGAAAAIVARLLAHAQAQGFSTVSLTAIEAAAAYWQRHGFILETASPSYGNTAVTMTKMLRSGPPS